MYGIYTYIARHPYLLIVGNFSLIISSAGMVAMPFLSGQMIEEVVTNNKDGLLKISLYFVGVAVLSGVFSFIRGVCFNLLGEKIIYELRTELYITFLYKDIEYFDVNKSGELMSRITSDCTLI